MARHIGQIESNFAYLQHMKNVEIRIPWKPYVFTQSGPKPDNQPILKKAAIRMCKAENLLRLL